MPIIYNAPKNDMGDTKTKNRRTSSIFMGYANSFLEGHNPYVVNEFDVGNGEEAEQFDGTGEGEDDTQTPENNPTTQNDTPSQNEPETQEDDTQVDFTDDGDGDDAEGADDQQEDDTQVDYTIDDTDEDDNNNQPEDGNDQSGEGDPSPEGEDDTQVDFTDDGTGERDGDIGSDDSGDFGDGEDPNSDMGSDDQYSGLKDIERELFDNLTDEQKNIKIKELKQNFADLHERCDGIIEILTNTTPSDESTVRVFDYIQKTLIDLQNNVKDYLSHTFNTKTYIENDAQFKSYLVILNTIQNILEELNIQK